MFVKQYDPNVGEANIIEVHNDVFNNELTIKSIHVRGAGVSLDILHEGVPIDILYRSNPSGEKAYMAFADEDYRASTTLIWNINGTKNIKLSRTERKENDYYEITKEQLLELCSASVLMVQVSGKNGILWEGDATGFIIVIQAVYNKAIDNMMFVDAISNAKRQLVDKVNQRRERIYTGYKNNEKKTSNTYLIVLLITIALIVIGVVAGLAIAL